MSGLQSSTHTKRPDRQTSTVSANVTEGLMARFNAYFLRYPNDKPSSACRVLHLDPRRYSSTARVAKCRIRKTWPTANVQADPLTSLTNVHRFKFRLLGGVPAGAVLDALLVAARSGCNKEDMWFASRNQNGQINYRNAQIAVRVLPTTRTLEVLCRKPGMTGLEVQECFRNVLVSTLVGRLPVDQYDPLHVAAGLSLKLVPVERHRRFTFPPSPYFQLHYYRDTLGITIQHDLSEKGNEQETIEMIPPWIPDLFECIEQVAEVQRETTQALQENTAILREMKTHTSENGSNVSGNAQNIAANDSEDGDTEQVV